jgi:hypothetical protein
MFQVLHIRGVLELTNLSLPPKPLSTPTLSVNIATFSLTINFLKKPLENKFFVLVYIRDS